MFWAVLDNNLEFVLAVLIEDCDDCTVAGPPRTANLCMLPAQVCEASAPGRALQLLPGELSPLRALADTRDSLTCAWPSGRTPV